MAVCYITPIVGGGIVSHGRVTPVADIYSHATVTLTTTATITATTAFHSAVDMLRVCSDTTILIGMGTHATAYTLLPANVVEYIRAVPVKGVFSCKTP